MEIDHGGFELGMAHVSLDDAQVDSGFEKMSGIGMTQGMNGDSLFVNSGSDLGAAEGALDTALGHGQTERPLLHCRLGQEPGRGDRGGGG